MGNKEQLRDSLEKENLQRKGGFWHSKSYHRFFEGYSEVSVPDPNGKGTVIQRIYTGDYYRQDLTKRQRLMVRVLYVALFLGVVYLFVSSAILPLASNSTWYVALSQAVSIPFLFWIIIAFVSYLPAVQDMTIGDYRSSSLALKKATSGAAISLGVVVLATLVSVFINQPDEPLDELLCAGKYLVGGFLAFLMNGIEKRVNYLIIPSQNRPTNESDEIS